MEANPTVEDFIISKCRGTHPQGAQWDFRVVKIILLGNWSLKSLINSQLRGSIRKWFGILPISAFHLIIYKYKNYMCNMSTFITVINKKLFIYGVERF